MISWGDVSAIDAGLASLDARTQDSILEMVQRQCNATAWGELRNDGMTFLAAHLGTIVKRQGVGGPVIMEKLGGMARSYGLMNHLGALSTTSYGIEYERMIQLLPRAVGLAV